LKGKKKELQRANFELGSMGNFYDTESKGHYITKSFEAVHNYKENGKTALTLSDNKEGYYRTSAKNDFYDKSKLSSTTRVSQEQQNAIQASHIIMGDDKTNYNSEAKSTMKYAKSAAYLGVPQQSMSNKARQTHFQTGVSGYKDT
jgi:hypothetical protein